jgi:hypothetical protein
MRAMKDSSPAVARTSVMAWSCTATRLARDAR